MLITAAMIARSVLAASPTDDAIFAARQALARGDAAAALNLASKAVDGDPKDPAPYSARAAIYEARREFGKAVDDYSRVIELSPDSIVAHERRGEDQFRLGHFTESVADFDKVIALQPSREPYHWQRGISLYYAGEFQRGAKQFETHKTVNPEDVENAVWHYLCVARTAGIAEARKELIPIRSDSRIPMMQVYAMFEGKAKPDDVLNAAKAGNPGEAELAERLFYAHLYIGLYLEAAGQTEAARQHIRLAADKYADNGYMGDVARVHAAVLKRAADAK
jgi:lipoprotein NlpI